MWKGRQPWYRLESQLNEVTEEMREQSKLMAEVGWNLSEEFLSHTSWNAIVAFSHFSALSSLLVKAGEISEITNQLKVKMALMDKTKELEQEHEELTSAQKELTNTRKLCNKVQKYIFRIINDNTPWNTVQVEGLYIPEMILVLY